MGAKELIKREIKNIGFAVQDFGGNRFYVYLKNRRVNRDSLLAELPAHILPMIRSGQRGNEVIIEVK